MRLGQNGSRCNGQQVQAHVKGVIIENWLPDGVTVNQHVYKKVSQKNRQKKEDTAVGKWFPP